MFASVFNFPLQSGDFACCGGPKEGSKLIDLLLQKCIAASPRWSLWFVKMYIIVPDKADVA
jgi:hypothetical protein